MASVPASQSILLLGAGELGTAIADALATHPKRNGASITVSMRPCSISNPSSSKTAEIAHLRAIHVEAMPLDLEGSSTSDLVKVFSRFGTIVGCMGFTTPFELQNKLSQAVVDSKVPRFIPWQFGVDYDIVGPDAGNGQFRQLVEARKPLRAQNTTKVVIITTGIFMSMLPVLGAIEVGGNGPAVHAYGNWQNRLTATTVEDIGRCTAEIILDGEEYWNRPGPNGQVVRLAGDTLTAEKLADTLEEATGKKVRRELWSKDVLQNNMYNEPENMLHRLKVIWADNRGLAWDKETSFNGQRNIPMRTAKAWAETNFSGGAIRV